MDTARAADEPCARCGRPIAWELSGNHPFGPTLDHLLPVLYTGTEDFEPHQAGVSHRVCNLRHGGAIGHRIPNFAPGKIGTEPLPVPVVYEPPEPPMIW